MVEEMKDGGPGSDSDELSSVSEYEVCVTPSREKYERSLRNVSKTFKVSVHAHGAARATDRLSVSQVSFTEKMNIPMWQASFQGIGPKYNSAEAKRMRQAKKLGTGVEGGYEATIEPFEPSDEVRLHRAEAQRHHETTLSALSAMSAVPPPAQGATTARPSASSAAAERQSARSAAAKCGPGVIRVDLDTYETTRYRTAADAAASVGKKYLHLDTMNAIEYGGQRYHFVQNSKPA